MATIMKILTPLATNCVLYAAAPPVRADPATVVPVANCHDSGPGSLRSAVFHAPDGAIIDLRALDCTRILLTSGAITVAQDGLQLLGRSRSALTVDGNNADRVLNHSGSGTLRITRLSIANGRESEQFAGGGCVVSNSSLVVESSAVHDCHTFAVKNPDDQCEIGCSKGAWGGALSANDIRLVHTTVSASSADDFTSEGGGVFARDRLTMFSSRLTGNVAMYGTAVFAGEVVAHESLIDHNGWDFDGNAYAEQGAIYVYAKPNSPGQAVLVRSAVVDNGAGCAAVCVEGRGAIVDSTIARNRGGKILWFRDEGLVANSTVAANSAGTGIVNDPVRCQGAITTPLLMLDSSIAALNRCGSNYALDIVAGTIVGSHNLVQWSRTRLPADTLRVNPKLQTLRFNGGPTPTMALLDGSAAVNRGSNPLGLEFDQRGRGFPRITGYSADIGAFEFMKP